MSFGHSPISLAKVDWFEILGPIALMAIYGASAVIKGFSERAKDKKSVPEDRAAGPSETSDKPRYKPLEEIKRSVATAKARALPYARAGQKEPTAPAPRAATERSAQPAYQLGEWDRQQQIKQARLKQMEAMRREKLLQQQRLQQQAHQDRFATVRTAPSASVHAAATPPAPSAQAVRKRIQEKPRQAHSAKPAGVSAQKATVHKQLSVKPVKPSITGRAAAIRALLRRKDSLRAAIILKEILDKPLALRDL